MQAHAQGAVFAHPARNVGLFGVEPGMIVADFGAGSGHYTFALARTLDTTGRVYAIDVQQDLLRRIGTDAQRQSLKNIEVIWGNVAKKHGSKLADASVHMVLISNLLFQLQEPGQALAEAARILRPSGRLILIDWLDSFRHMGPTKQHVVKKERALEMAQAAQFELLQEFSAGSHHWGLIMSANTSDAAHSASASRTRHLTV